MRLRRTLPLVAAVLMTACETITTPTPVADTDLLQREFSSILVPGGTASRDFAIAAAGPIAVTLKSTTPDGVSIGLGLGIPRSNGSCALSSAVETAAGSTAQISLSAAVGSYCAKVYDLGTLASPLAFTVSISRP